MSIQVGAYRLLAPTAASPIAPLGGNAELLDIRADARALKQATRRQAQAPAPLFALPELSALLNRLFAWLSPQPQPQPATGKTEFVVSSFNILGSQHTRGHKSPFDSGVERTGYAVDLLRQRKIDVVGFQEMQRDQVQEFKRLAGQEFGLYPGNSLRPNDAQNSIAWRKDTWDLVKAENHIMPFLDGMQRGNPVVLLKHKQTGEMVYVTNFHNAPRRPGGDQQQGWRDKATTMQVALINRLKRTGVPVIVTGDMNERENYQRRMAREADMTAANTGKVGIDWIFGSDGVTFKNFVRDRGPLAKKTTDHPVLVSRVQI